MKFSIENIPEERKQSPVEFSANFGVDLAFPDPDSLKGYGLIVMSGAIMREIHNDPEAVDMLLDFLNDCEVIQKVQDDEKDVTVYLITHEDLPVVKVSQGIPLYSIRFKPNGEYAFQV